MNCWPSGKHVNLLYMYSILCRGSFCLNYCLNSAWHGGDQFVALLRWKEKAQVFPAGIVHDWGETLEQGTEPPTAPRALHCRLPTAPSVCAFGWVKCRAQISLLVIRRIIVCVTNKKYSSKCLGKRVQWHWFSKNTMDQHQKMTLHPRSSQTVET